MRYIAIFLPALVSIPLVSYLFFYYVLLSDWLQPNREKDFQIIKQTLLRYGAISQKKGDDFSSHDLASNNSYYAKEAVRLARLDLSGKDLYLRLILPLIVVLCAIIVYTLNFWLPGVTRNSDVTKREMQEKSLDYLPEKILDYLNDLFGVSITVNGFIIALLGGFLLTSGLINFYFFLGFETIIFSLISSLFIYPSFISSIKLEQPHDNIPVDKSSLMTSLRIANFTAWSLILGLILLATSLI